MSTYTLHPETKLGPVHLTVSDMARSLNFYRDVLGFRLLEQSADRVSLTADGASPILLLTEVPGARAGFPETPVSITSPFFIRNGPISPAP